VPLTLSPNLEVLTSEERWRRWEQRSLDDDVRFMHQMRLVFWSAGVIVTAALVAYFLF
jgi:hypothetical protein